MRTQNYKSTRNYPSVHPSFRVASASATCLISLSLSPHSFWLSSLHSLLHERSVSLFILDKVLKSLLHFEKKKFECLKFVLTTNKKISAKTLMGLTKSVGIGDPVDKAYETDTIHSGICAIMGSGQAIMVIKRLCRNSGTCLAVVCVTICLGSSVHVFDSMNFTFFYK